MSVAPGTYFESLTMKPGVQLHGDPGTILDGSHTGGAVVSAWSGVESTAVLSGFIIRRGQRAGILLNQAAPTIRNNVITENAGPGIVCAQASPRIVNNIITANAEGGVVCTYPETAPVLTYNAFWKNQPAHVSGCALGEGNREQDPRFVDALQGNYQLRADSPFIDAGDPATVFNDADGSRSDLGVYGGPQPLQLPQRTREAAQAAGGKAKRSSVRDSLSFQGLPGIINVPTATTVPSGSVDVHYNTKRDPLVADNRGADRQQTFNFAIGLLPRVTIGGRGTVATNTDTGLDVARDISANLQFLLLEEGPWWPSVAAGLQDVSGGANLFRSRYVVLSKTALNRVRGTVGFGIGPDVLDGPFAGLEVALNPFITLLGEYDTEDINAGLRLFPVPKQLEAYGVPRPTVDLIWQDGKRFAWGISVRSALGESKYQAQRAARAHKRYHRRSAPPPPLTEAAFEGIAQELQAELIERGLENVRVAIGHLEQGDTVVVEYENRRYNRDELDGLGLVLGLTAIHTPPAITHMRVIVKEVNIPVLQVAAAIDDFLTFTNEQMSAEVFAQRFHVTQQAQWPFATHAPAVTTAIGNRSWLKVDAILRPGIETRILTDDGVADIRFRLLPDAFVQLTPGTVVNVRGTIPVTQTPGFPGQPGDPRLSRALLHQAVRLPLGSWSRVTTGLTQFSIGRFNLGEIGIANETALTFLDGLLFVKGTVARVGSSFSDLEHWVALANGRVRYPPWDLTLSVTAGQFLDDDRGVAIDLSRFFGNTEVGVFLRHTDNGSLGGVRLGFPLTPAKELKPMYFRPRLPELFPYAQQTTVFTDANVVRGNIGRTLSTGHDIERVYWNRDRLYPVYIRQHLDTLKQAVRSWIDDAS